MAYDIVQTRKAKSKEAKGKLGGYNMEESKDLFQQQVERENDNFPPSDSVNKRFQPPTDSSNDSSSLFDESSSCSTESRSDSTTTEENSGDLDFINSNSPPPPSVSKFTHSK